MMRTRFLILVLLATVFGSLVELSAQSLTLYTEENLPFNGMGKDNKLTGFGPELVAELQKRLSVDHPISLVPWARGLQATQTGTNSVLFCTSRNLQRDKTMQWVGPIIENGFAFYALANSKVKIESLDDAKKVRSIGVVKSAAPHQFLINAGFTNFDEVTTYVTNFEKLLLGTRIDLVFCPQVIPPMAVVEAGGKMEDLKEVYVANRSQLWIAFSKDIPVDTINRWQAALDSAKKDGTFAKIHKKWFGNLPLPGPAITEFK